MSKRENSTYFTISGSKPVVARVVERLAYGILPVSEMKRASVPVGFYISVPIIGGVWLQEFDLYTHFASPFLPILKGIVFL